MSRSTLRSRPGRFLAAAVAATAVLGGALAAGAGSAIAQNGSSVGSLEGLGSVAEESATAVFDNITVTKEVVGADLRIPGTTFGYRTTVAASGAPPRELTRLLALEPGDNEAVARPVDGTAKVTYTASDGTRRTEPAQLTWATWTLTDGSKSTGWELSTAGWQISADQPLVLETRYQWIGQSRNSGHEGFRDRFDTAFALEVTGLGRVQKSAMGPQTQCMSECSAAIFTPFGS
ncbi:hypothetical protein FCG67_02195 [Rhodococcus oryzae]|uniref:DUF3047 domain-containing protein n=1 Tax=Rhodococcus oryzae TaxID=2571143 RepID=A0ABY2RQW3_9NOCA|nr:hypothetical protein [Rhodococcus oryzae]TJZ81456.1 hypothetical protein FCG67_02195 [Rhodococcus oryzae]